PQGGARVATILAVKPIDTDLFPELKQPGVRTPSAEAILVRRDGQVVTYLSPLADGTAPLKRRLATNSPSLTAALALNKPGAFVTGRDYRDKDVLATSRRIDGTGWVLIYKIDRDVAMGPVDDRLNRLLIILLLALAVTVIGIAAIWRHGASRRASIAATRYQETANALAEQRDLMRAVLDNQPTSVFMTDQAGQLRFANKSTADRAGMNATDMPGKTLPAVFGADAARPYQRLALQALETGEPAREVRRATSDEDGPVVLQSVHVPVSIGADQVGILTVDEDITTAILEREKREKTLSALTRTILTLIDRRDPNAAHQSIRVAHVAEAIAQEMALSPSDIEAAGIAGSLTNIGKLLVPSELLTKPGSLTPEELTQVREAIDQGPTLLAGIEFGAPIVDALEKIRERWDGTGPRAEAGEAIPTVARIVSVANAFVAMASPRAHRGAMDVDAVCAALQSEAGSAFDRRVVSALVNWLDNRNGRDWWADGKTGGEIGDEIGDEIGGGHTSSE
ncbi:MAG: HD domain-containing phosphohydrolase, partial [Pseudomonadota bacterium]